jgi:hypothetical protein
MRFPPADLLCTAFVGFLTRFIVSSGVAGPTHGDSDADLSFPVQR